MLVDTHCHLDMIPDYRISLLRAKEAGVTTIINVGTSIDASRKSIEIANGTDLVDVYATCGIHAQEGAKDIKKYGSLEKCMGVLKQLILRQAQDDKKRVVAIGECGMDFFLEATNQGSFGSAQDKPATTADEKRAQRELFEAQVGLAIELDLPLIIHCRNAWEETFEIITNYKLQKSKRPGLFHSWTGTVEQAKRALDWGFYISFSGIITFKNAGEIPEVAKMVPDERILVETDSPFLSPVPLRGKQNEPKNVKMTAQFLANLRGVSLDKISGITTDNSRRLFGIK